MSDLTKFEEQILLSVWRLQREAYGISIYNHIRAVTKKDMAIGGIYFPLERLVKRGYLKAVQGDPTPVRGGQSKRYYRLTKHGLDALKEARREEDVFWAGLPRSPYALED
jgi:PadR family transcriptional regulator PadR